jgi:hypothetical protein
MVSPTSRCDISGTDYWSLGRMGGCPILSWGRQAIGHWETGGKHLGTADRPAVQNGGLAMMEEDNAETSQRQSRERLCRSRGAAARMNE